MPKNKTQKVIIPKGTLNPNEDTLIEIPRSIQDQPVVVASPQNYERVSYSHSTRNVELPGNHQYSLVTSRSKFKVEEQDQSFQPPFPSTFREQKPPCRPPVAKVKPCSRSINEGIRGAASKDSCKSNKSSGTIVVASFDRATQSNLPSSSFQKKTEDDDVASQVSSFDDFDLELFKEDQADVATNVSFRSQPSVILPKPDANSTLNSIPDTTLDRPSRASEKSSRKCFYSKPRDAIDRDRDLRDRRDSVERDRPKCNKPRDSIDRDKSLSDRDSIERDRLKSKPRDSIDRDRDLLDRNAIERERLKKLYNKPVDSVDINRDSTERDRLKKLYKRPDVEIDDVYIEQLKRQFEEAKRKLEEAITLASTSLRRLSSNKRQNYDAADTICDSVPERDISFVPGPSSSKQNRENKTGIEEEDGGYSSTILNVSMKKSPSSSRTKTSISFTIEKNDTTTQTLSDYSVLKKVETGGAVKKARLEEGSGSKCSCSSQRTSSMKFIKEPRGDFNESESFLGKPSYSSQ